MKKFVISSVIMAVFMFVGAQNSDAATYRTISGHIVKTSGTTPGVVQNSAQYRYRPPVGYRMNRPVVLTGGVNYIDREIGSGKIKQVVQVGPTPVYYSPYIY